jgi:predicted RNA-binding Zn ribbon-like protein
MYGSYMSKAQNHVEYTKFAISSNNSNEPLLIFCNTSRAQNETVFENLQSPQDYISLIKKHFNLKNIEFNTSSVNLAEIRHLRQILKTFFSNIIINKKIKANDLLNVNKLVFESSLGLVFDTNLEIDIAPVASKAYLKPIILEMVRFLPNLELKRLKKCNNKNCTHLFFDSSKNNSRIWCSMSSCGNIMKARSFYKRSKLLKKLN